MEPEQTTSPVESVDRFENLRKVTPLSKYLAMMLFIIMPFIGVWIGYVYAPEKVVEVEKLVFSQITPAENDFTSALESEDDRVSMPSYKFNVYSGLDANDSQVIVEGILSPVLLRAMGRASTSISLRCWQKTMNCIYATLTYSDLGQIPILKLENLKVVSWNEGALITVEGVEGTYPDCERDFCTSQARFTLDTEKREGGFFQTYCADNCATDEYIITGQKYGDLAPPVVPISVEKWINITN